MEALLALYEPDAIHCVDAGHTDRGLSAIRRALSELVTIPGEMVSLNRICIAGDDLALLRADWSVTHGDHVIASGSSMEIVRKQPDGRWLYVIDHAFGASLGPD